MGVFPKEEKADLEDLGGPQAPSSEDPTFRLSKASPGAYSIYRNAIMCLVYFSMHVFLSKEKINTPPNFFQCKLFPLSRIYHVFHKLLSTTQLPIKFYHFVHILSPFDNELIKNKLREVDAMYEIKIRVLRRLYQQIFKATMLKKMPSLCKNDS
jgi:hypothetical protein